MNAIAMNQALFGNVVKFGQGFISGQQTEKLENINGWKMYVNGINPIPPVTEELEHRCGIGTLEHESLMMGMPTAGGVVQYDLYESESSFFLVIGVKLDPSMLGESEMCHDIAVQMQKDDMSETFMPRDIDAQLILIIRNLLYGHFVGFLDSEHPQMTVDDLYFGEESGMLEEFIQDYIKAVNDLKS